MYIPSNERTHYVAPLRFKANSEGGNSLSKYVLLKINQLTITLRKSKCLTGVTFDLRKYMIIDHVARFVGSFSKKSCLQVI